MSKYFLYARKSTDVEDKQVLSIEAQLAELRALAKHENLSISDEFIEKRSAKMPGRPIFNDMLRRIQTGAIPWTADKFNGFCNKELSHIFKPTIEAIIQTTMF